jgi:hypothetical protein
MGKILRIVVLGGKRRRKFDLRKKIFDALSTKNETSQTP